MVVPMEIRGQGLSRQVRLGKETPCNESLTQRQDKQGVENSETTPGILESEPRGPVEKQTKKHT
jgi:hypothetical protein